LKANNWTEEDMSQNWYGEKSGQPTYGRNDGDNRPTRGTNHAHISKFDRLYFGVSNENRSTDLALPWIEVRADSFTKHN